MKSGAGALLLAMLAAGAIGGDVKSDKKGTEPFYRRYLVAGNALDDQIVEQERRVEASPQDSNLRNDFGNLLAARKFPKEAAEQYEIALKLDKANFVSAYNLGLLRETEGKVVAAISAYKRSIGRKPGFPQSHFRLGRIYEHKGERGAAVREYAKAMRIDPEMRDPKRNPLAVDSELIYQASLENYRRDMAAASMHKESFFFEEARFRRMPIDRSLTSEEVSSAEPETAPAPREIGPGSAAGAPVPEPAAPSRHPARPTSAEAPGGILGGRRPTPGPRAKTTRPVPPAPAPTEPAPGTDTIIPETMPEPTPTPGPPVEVEPS
ncbi:MAG TPA: tetratricopeptide repeat protein [Thermoanaerobaculia bacterium]|jgi:hypothetical protein